MIKKLFQSRNVFKLFKLYAEGGKKYKSKFSKFFESYNRDSVKAAVQNPNESQKLDEQIEPKPLTQREIDATICAIKQVLKVSGPNNRSNNKRPKPKPKPNANENEKTKANPNAPSQPNNVKCEKTKNGKNNENNQTEKGKNENPCEGKSNLSAVFYKDGEVRLEECEKPQPCSGEVLIEMNCVGLCSTDLSTFMTGKLSSPMILGRDGTGTVVELGEGVENLNEGDRVVIQPYVHCGTCEFCKKCKFHLCSKVNSCALVPYDGLLTCYYKLSAENCLKLPDCISFEEGVLLNMLASGIHVCTTCPSCIGMPVLIIGSGPVGLVSLIAAQATGAANTCVMCKFQDRLKVAEQYNTKTLQIEDDVSSEEMAHRVRETLGCLPIITIDSVGSESSMQLATAATSSGGSIILASVTDGDHKIRLHEIAHRDITIRSALRHPDTLSTAIALANNGNVNLKPLISHHFKFEEVSEAVKLLIENQELTNKIVIHIAPRKDS